MNSSRKERALWLGQYVLPHEAKMRAWLERKVLGDLEIDDVIQETFAILSELDSVEDIRDPKSYAFQTAFSIIQRHLRRSRIVSFQTFTALEQINEHVNVVSDAPSPESEVSDRGDLRSVEDYIAKLPQKY